jgi:hypothetical protein
MNTQLEFATRMQARTKTFAVQIVKFFGKLPKTDEARARSTRPNAMPAVNSLIH